MNEPGEPNPIPVYVLTAEERQAFTNLHQAALARKSAVHDLNMQLEVEQGKREEALAMFAGALSLLAIAHNMPNGRLTPDFTQIISQ